MHTHFQCLSTMARLLKHECFYSPLSRFQFNISVHDLCEKERLALPTLCQAGCIRSCNVTGPQRRPGRWTVPIPFAGEKQTHEGQ